MKMAGWHGVGTSRWVPKDLPRELTFHSGRGATVLRLFDGGRRVPGRYHRFAPGDGDPQFLNDSTSLRCAVASSWGAGRPMKGDRAAIEVVRVNARGSVDPCWGTVVDCAAECSCLAIHRPRPHAGDPAKRGCRPRSVVYEPFGILQLEALASGTPVVAGQFGSSDFLDLSEVLAGWIVPDPHDVSALKTAVEDVFSDLGSASEKALGVRPGSTTGSLRVFGSEPSSRLSV